MITVIKKIFLYLFVVIFYLLTPLCLFAVINTGVSLKYEVDQPRIFVDINQKYSNKEKEIAFKEIDEHEKELKKTYYLWMFAAFAFPITATSLIINRKRIINTKNIKKTTHNKRYV